MTALASETASWVKLLGTWAPGCFGAGMFERDTEGRVGLARELISMGDGTAVEHKPEGSAVKRGQVK
jgi:hypothetical protein